MSEPFPESALAKAWQWANEWPLATLDDRAPKDLEEMRQQFRSERRRSFLVGSEAKPIGAIWFDDPAEEGLVLGHLLFARGVVSRKQKLDATAEALRLLFSAGQTRKVCWPVFADNWLFLAFLGKLGAAHEGLLRQQILRGGRPVDLVLMASFPE